MAKIAVFGRANTDYKPVDLNCGGEKMKAARMLLILVIIVSIFSFSLYACSWVDNGRGPDGKSARNTPQPGSIQAYDLTATYGADQFHIQLTAIANSQVVGSNNGNP